MDRTGSRARVSGAPLISKALAGCDDAGFDTFEPGVRYARGRLGIVTSV